MKKLKCVLTFLIMLVISLQNFAQIPQKFNYQAVCRDNTGSIIASQPVNFRLSIRDLIPSGTIIYQETQIATTNIFGLATLEIGGGTIQTGTFNNIPWSAGDKYFEVEINWGSGYIPMGTTQLLSVPFALHSKTAETITGTISENDPIFGASPANGILSTNITNWNAAFGWGNHSNAGHLSSFTEVDPAFSASPSFGITNTNITNWNSAFSWGNHASVGYLTSFTEVDPLFTTNFDVTGSLNGDLLKFNGAKYVKFTPNYLTSFTEFDPAFTNNFDFTGATANDLLQYNGTKWVKLTPDFSLSTHTHSNATTTVNGFMSSVDKTKLDGLQNANISAGTGISVSGTYPNIQIAESAKHYIGEPYEGGIVFWISPDGLHGLACAKTDQSSGVRWSAGTITNTMSKATGLMSGEMNTALIIASQGLGDGSTYAARLCTDYQITEGTNTYGGWFLPSQKEFQMIYLSKATVNAALTAQGGTIISDNNYWTSTEESSNANATIIYYSNNGYGGAGKTSLFRVRAIRAF